MANLLFYSSLFLIWFMLIYHMFLMQGGYLHFFNFQKTEKLWSKTKMIFPKVSVLIPAHNEEVVIEDTIKAMINLKYPLDKLEVIIINDNSSDLTGEIAASYAAQYPFLKVVNTTPEYAGKGKSSALNYGLQKSKGDIIVVYDADNTPEPEAVYYLVLGLQNDPKAGAMVGKFRVSNAAKNILTRFINVETITFQWLAQAGRWHWFNLATIPGTNFAIRRSILEELGGWDDKALSEDTELSIRVYNLGYYIRFFPAAITWEQEPETWGVWWKQRTRWARGNQYVITKYLFNFFSLKNKKVILDLFYFLFTYMLFLWGVMVSNILFIMNLFTDLNLSGGTVSIVLFVLAFLLFLSEISLALSIERNQLNIKTFLVVILMYFTYSQIWLVLVLYSLFLEVKRTLFKQEIKWYKTQRYKQSA
ncbi:MULTISPECIES: glycosyltransferase [unclassified Bacillus (in: firmicutes)]|uniref:glycosyltransferase family 2 protein n=1 Tax=unclassified Bacillus (in: firmicutes) TaxID=185979 RepID=UPI0008E3314E|nr:MULTISPECIES: glycosyltransferase [unclassified Bacillus (in: firmicutes)]SFB20747.1 Glycosyltransferase, catalytic subunit of cellulose synthase and poly-beta-1,6-N-acetylglucosamine synthase [Bacillus sp. UNCCL13]SFQ90901.1 Glycosyltransferase, catalytic subunit of cellulose synthase and poly-beta-1,6-N-acetylglucosamine synthase [Bacillus sp. cl95]